MSTSGSAAPAPDSFDSLELVLEDDTGERPDVHALQPAHPPAVPEQHLGLRELQGVGDLRTGPPAVECDGHPTEGGHGPERQHPFDAVGGADADPVTLFDAVLVPEAPGHRRHGVDDGLEAELALGEHRVGTPAEALHAAAQDLDDGARTVGEHLHDGAQHLLFRQLEGGPGADEGTPEILGEAGVGPDQRHRGRHSITVQPATCPGPAPAGRCPSRTSAIPRRAGEGPPFRS